MVKKEIYKGIEFVRLSKLPEEQAVQIKEWSRSKRITILTDAETWRDCIQYKDYQNWYENSYKPVPAKELSQVNIQKPAAKNNQIRVPRIFNFLTSKS
ncbi:MAG: hypothetical protein ACNS60_12600 [Candidatus Cyclobacteriaceae bacterium M2_1C_046]